MADDDLPPTDDELLDPVDPAAPNDLDDDPPPDDANPEADDDALGDPDDTDPDGDQRRRPDPTQRESRRRREEDFDQRVERAVERRLSRQQPHQPDFSQQRREVEARRKQELDDARMQGPEVYADARDRHLREDFDARERAREARESDNREQDRFERLCDRDKIVSSVRPLVDRRVQELRADGITGPLNREIIANDIIAKRYRERAARAGTQQRRAAATTNARQTVRNPTSASGQQSAPRSRRGNFADLSVEDMERTLGTIPVKSVS